MLLLGPYVPEDLCTGATTVEVFGMRVEIEYVCGFYDDFWRVNHTKRPSPDLAICYQAGGKKHKYIRIRELGMVMVMVMDETGVHRIGGRQWV